MSLKSLYGWLVETAGQDRGDAFYRWMTVDHPVWARQIAERLDAVRAKCERIEAGTTATPRR